jgi:hypothetical protein
MPAGEATVINEKNIFVSRDIISRADEGRRR